MRFVKPLDVELILGLAKSHDLLVTLEENVIAGGAGSGVNEALLASGATPSILNLGIPDMFPAHGNPDAELATMGLDPAGILASVRARLADNPELGAREQSAG